MVFPFKAFLSFSVTEKDLGIVAVAVTVAVSTLVDLVLEVGLTLTAGISITIRCGLLFFESGFNPKIFTSEEEITCACVNAALIQTSLPCCSIDLEFIVLGSI